MYMNYNSKKIKNLSLLLLFVNQTRKGERREKNQRWEEVQTLLQSRSEQEGS